MMAYVLSRPMLAFVAVYLVMAVGIGFIVKFELTPPAEHRPIQPQSAAIELVTVAVQRSK